MPDLCLTCAPKVGWLRVAGSSWESLDRNRAKLPVFPTSSQSVSRLFQVYRGTPRRFRDPPGTGRAWHGPGRRWFQQEEGDLPGNDPPGRSKRDQSTDVAPSQKTLRTPTSIRTPHADPISARIYLDIKMGYFCSWSSLWVTELHLRTGPNSTFVTDPNARGSDDPNHAAWCTRGAHAALQRLRRHRRVGSLVGWIRISHRQKPGGGRLLPSSRPITWTLRKKGMCLAEPWWGSPWCLIHFADPPPFR